MEITQKGKEHSNKKKKNEFKLICTNNLSVICTHHSTYTYDNSVK